MKPRLTGREVGTRPIVAKDPLIKHGGDYSLRMDIVEDVEEEAPSSLGMVKENGRGWNVVPVEPGQRYVLRGWFRGKDLVPGAGGGNKRGSFLEATIYLSDGSDIFGAGSARRTVNVPIRDEGTTEWTAFEKEFETSPEETSLWLVFRVHATGGKIWLDDVEIVPAP